LLAEELISLLAPVESATRELCGDKYPTASMIIPTIRLILDSLEAMKLKSDEATDFNATLVANLKERFEFRLKNKTLLIATLLDPRFKAAGLTEPGMLEEAKAAVLEMLSSLPAARNVQNSNKRPADETLANSAAKQAKFDFLGGLQSAVKKRQAEASVADGNE
jgi:hypothetical protein